MFDYAGILLPVKFKPLPDELFSSWLVRLSRENATKLHTFSTLVFPRRRAWNIDLDKSADDWHLARMIEHTGYGSDIIENTFLRSFAGKFYVSHNPFGITPWVMPVGVSRQKRKDYGLQMCPACLRSDQTPYFRREWRLSWVTVCAEHRLLLLDRCPGCSSPLMIHRGEMGWHDNYMPAEISVCPVCEFSWRSIKAIEAAFPADEQSLMFQQKLKQVVAENWTQLPNHEIVHVISFFNGLKQLVKLLSFSRRSQRFRQTVILKSGLQVGETQKRHFDLLAVEDRRRTLRLAAWLLERWPERFIEAASASRTWSAFLLAEMPNAPFWYWREVHDHLMRHSHQTTTEEVSAALDYLLRQNQLVMPTHLKSLLGKTDLFRKSLGEIELAVYERMKRHNQQLFQAECQTETRNKRILRMRANRRIRYLKFQTHCDERIVPLKERERLRWVKRYEENGNLQLVGKEFDVSPGIVKKWHARYREQGLAGLVEHSRVPHRLPHRKIFDEQEQWILEQHQMGMNMTEICHEVKQRHNLQITLWVVRKVLDKYELKPAHGIGDWREKQRRPHKKIFAEQEEWIVSLNLEGYNNSAIQRELLARYNFSVGVWSIRAVLKSHRLRSPRKYRKPRKTKQKVA